MSEVLKFLKDMPEFLESMYGKYKFSIFTLLALSTPFNISPVLIYILLYKVDFLKDNDFFIVLITILVFSGFLYIIIYSSSLIFSSLVLSYIPKLLNKKDSNNIAKVNIIITALFMLILTLIIMYPSIKYKHLFDINNSIIFIKIYIFTSIIFNIYCYLRFKKEIKKLKVNKVLENSEN